MESDAAVIRFSLENVPERERREALTEVFGRGVVNMDFVPLDDRPFFEFEIRRLPGVAITCGRNSPHIGKSGHDPSMENDDFMLAWATRPSLGRLIHRGDEIAGDGSGAFSICAEPMVGETRSFFPFANVRVARQLLIPLLPHAEDRLMDRIAPSCEALRLLNAYLDILIAKGEPECPALSHAVALHIADLVALAVGTTRDAAEQASRRGLRAARTAAVKAWILKHIAQPELSIVTAARANGISPRYIQLLFAHEGTSYSDWLRTERLALAHRRLSDPMLAHRSIACIAFDSGFSDLSWFNRAFRQAYGRTPSDVRHAAFTGTRH